MLENEFGVRRMEIRLERGDSFSDVEIVYLFLGLEYLGVE